MIAWNWAVGSGIRYKHSHLIEAVSPGRGVTVDDSSIFATLSVLHCMERKKAIIAPPLCIKFTNIPELPINALMHLQHKVLTNQQLKLMQLSLNDVVTI